MVMFLITMVTLSVGTHFITDLSDRINYATHRPNTDVSQSLSLFLLLILSLHSFNNFNPQCQSYLHLVFGKQVVCYLLGFEY